MISVFIWNPVGQVSTDTNRAASAVFADEVETMKPGSTRDADTCVERANGLIHVEVTERSVYEK